MVPASDGFEGSGQYAALSYRWGDSTDPLLLTVDNLDAFRRGEFFRPLPQTFQDAISICRGLEINYLWIDALCIIQREQSGTKDSDWEKQAPKMSDVYSHAYLTVAADAARNPDAGFLEADREEALQAVSEVSAPGPDNASGVIFTRPRTVESEFDGFLGHRTVTGHGKQSYLSDRGWTLQESLLSPHVVHFAREEIAWQCAARFACECAAWAGRSEEGYATPPIETGLESEQLDILSPIRPKALHSNWLRIVEIFAARELTTSSDRLFALAGLARRAQNSRPGVQYLAGVWEEEIKESLLWQSRWPFKTKRIEPRIGPSWSWASVDKGVSYYQERSGEIDLDVAEIDSSVLEKDQYGSVPQGKTIELIVTGHVSHVRAVQFQLLSHTWLHGTCILHFEFPISVNVQDNSHVNTAVGIFWADTVQDFELVASGQDVTVLNCRSFTQFLVLTKPQSSDRLYRRLGLLTKPIDFDSYGEPSSSIPSSYLGELKAGLSHEPEYKLRKGLLSMSVPGPLGRTTVPRALSWPFPKAMGSRAQISIG